MNIAPQQVFAPLNPDQDLKLEFWNAVTTRTNQFTEKDHTLACLMNEAAMFINRSDKSLSRTLIEDTCRKQYGKDEYSYGSILLTELLPIYTSLTISRTSLRLISYPR